MTKWFWVTIEGYLSYILPKFEEFIPTGLGSGALNIHSRIYPYHSVSFKVKFIKRISQMITVQIKKFLFLTILETDIVNISSIDPCIALIT